MCARTSASRLPPSGHGPFLFTGNEAALAQDGPAATPTNGSVARLLRFRLGSGQVDRTFVYPVDAVAAEPVPPTAFSVNGLVELLPLNNQFLLAMERSFSVGVGNAVTLHLVGLPGADDVSGLDSLVGADVEPVTKTEVLDLNTLGLTLDNLEGMTFGPRLADGRRSLLIVSDNNFTPGQVVAVPALRRAVTGYQTSAGYGARPRQEGVSRLSVTRSAVWSRPAAVVTFTTVDLVAAGSAEQHIVLGRAEQPVVPAAAAGDQGRCATVEHLVRIGADEAPPAVVRQPDRVHVGDGRPPGRGVGEAHGERPPVQVEGAADRPLPPPR